MRTFSLCIFLFLSTACFSQKNDKISTITFVEIVNNNYDETIYYFQNNWKILRDMALKKGYIYSYQIMEAPTKEGEEFRRDHALRSL